MVKYSKHLHEDKLSAWRRASDGRLISFLCDTMKTNYQTSLEAIKALLYLVKKDGPLEDWILNAFVKWMEQYIFMTRRIMSHLVRNYMYSILKVKSMPKFDSSMIDQLKARVKCQLVNIEDKLNSLKDVKIEFGKMTRSRRLHFIAPIRDGVYELGNSYQELINVFVELSILMTKIYTLQQVHNIDGKLVRNMNWIEIPHIYWATNKWKIRRNHMAHDLGIPYIVQWVVYDRSFKKFQNEIALPIERLMNTYYIEKQKEDNKLSYFGIGYIINLISSE
jgi:hypothetical protein